MDWAPMGSIRHGALPRVHPIPGGKPIRNLSPAFEETTWTPIGKAYVTVMRHLKEIGRKADRTGNHELAVENESGPARQRAATTPRNPMPCFAGPVPEKKSGDGAQEETGDVDEVSARQWRTGGFHGLLSFQLYQRGGARRPSRSTRCDVLWNCWNGGHDTARSVGFLRPAGRDVSEARTGCRHMLDLWKAGGSEYRHPSLSDTTKQPSEELPHDQPSRPTPGRITRYWRPRGRRDGHRRRVSSGPWRT